MEYSSTLLIVESPELKRRIDALKIPYLTNFATHGFLWWPELNADETRLLRRANKTLIDQRRELKREASHAVNIICATDTDAAGRFIAWSCQNFLKREVSLQPLSALNKSSLWTMIRRAEHHQANPKNLQNTLFWLTWLQKKARPLLKNLPNGLRHLSSLLLADVLQYPENHAVQAEVNHPTASAKHQLQLKYQNLPRILAEQYLQKRSMSKTYQELWNLYLHNEALVNYPRTSSAGFYLSTWQDHIPSYRNHDLCMTPLRSVLPDSSAHESIRVTDLTITPDDTRKWLPRYQRELYESIWNRSRSILYPSQQELSYLFDHQQNDMPRQIEVGDLCRIIDDHHLLRNSKLHATLSSAISNKWIRLEERNQRICVIPDDFLPSFTSSLQQGFKQIRACLNQPIEQKNTIKKTKAILSEVLADMSSAILTDH